MSSTALVVFASQYFMVLLLGLQSQFVRDSNILMAAIVSTLLGATGWIITGIISTAYNAGMFSVIYFCFVAAGPLGIVSSIMLHKYFKGGQRGFR